MIKRLRRISLLALVAMLFFSFSGCDLFNGPDGEPETYKLFADAVLKFFLKDVDTPDGDELVMSAAWEGSATISVDENNSGLAEFVAYPAWWGGGVAWAQVPDAASGLYDLSGVATISFEIKSETVTTDEVAYMVQWLGANAGEGGEFAVSLTDLGVTDISTWTTVTVDMTAGGDISDDTAQTGRYGKTAVSFFTQNGNQYVDTAFALKWLGDAGTSPNTGSLTAGDTYLIRNIKFLDASDNNAAIADDIIYENPTSGAAAPTLAEADVISFHTSTNTYTNTTVDNWNPAWGQAGSLADYDTGNGVVKLLDLQNYQGVDFDANRKDITGMTTLHISYYTTEVTGFLFFPIWDGGEGSVDTGALTTDGAWHDLELDLSTIGGIDLTTIRQFKFDISSYTSGTIYLDNIYLH